MGLGLALYVRKSPFVNLYERSNLSIRIEKKVMYFREEERSVNYWTIFMFRQTYI